MGNIIDLRSNLSNNYSVSKCLYNTGVIIISADLWLHSVHWLELIHYMIFKVEFIQVQLSHVLKFTCINHHIRQNYLSHKIVSNYHGREEEHKLQMFILCNTRHKNLSGPSLFKVKIQI